MAGFIGARRMRCTLGALCALAPALLACGRAETGVGVAISDRPSSPGGSTGAPADASVGVDRASTGGVAPGVGDAAASDHTDGRVSGDASTGGGGSGARDASLDAPHDRAPGIDTGVLDATADTRPAAPDASAPDAPTPPLDAGLDADADASVDPLVGSYDVYGEGYGRLDLELRADGYHALITAPYGHPTELPVTVTNASVELSGPLVVEPPPFGPYAAAEEFVNLVLPRLADGRLAPAPTTVAFSTPAPDPGPCVGIIDDLPILVTPRLSPDVTAPYVYLDRTTESGWFLPWDPVRVAVTEGVAAASLLPRLSLVRQGTSIELGAPAWAAVAKPTEAGWDAIVRAEGRALDWDAIDGATVELVAAAGATDRAGNASPGSVSPALSFRATGPAVAAFDFDGPTTLATWGAVTIVAPGTAEAARCESGGCIELGAPIAALAGFAGRIAPKPGATELRIRYRFLSAATLGASILALEVVRPGGVPVSTPLPVAGLAEQGADAGSLHLATAWATLAVPLPPATEPVQVGFRVAMTGSALPCAAGIDTMLVVDSVTVQ